MAKWWVLVAVGTGTFMSALDGSVVNATLPVMTTTLNSTVAVTEWVVTIYLLVVSGLLLSVGRFGDLRGHKPVYILGYTIFIISSALCGLAQTAGVLIVFRGIQALGAAMLFANSPAILSKNFPAGERGRALGLQATLTYLGLSVGPSLGGWLTHQFGWQAVFYINVPVGLLGLFFSLRFIPNDHGSVVASSSHAAEKFDPAGALTFMAGLVMLLLGLNQGHAWGWASPAILALLGGSVVLLAAFILIELRVPSPMLDLSLFGRRVFSAATASALLNYICLYSTTFMLPFYLIQGRGLNPAQAGLILTAQPLVMAIAAPISGSLSDRIGSRFLSTLGLTILAVGLFLLSRLGPDSATLQILLGLAVAGLGNGIFISPNNNALLGSAPPNRQGIASGVLASARNVGMVLGVGLAGAIFTTVQTSTAVGADAGLFQAVQISLSIAAGLALLGALVSFGRGKTQPQVN